MALPLSNLLNDLEKEKTPKEKAVAVSEGKEKLKQVEWTMQESPTLDVSEPRIADLVARHHDMEMLRHLKEQEAHTRHMQQMQRPVLESGVLILSHRFTARQQCSAILSI